MRPVHPGDSDRQLTPRFKPNARLAREVKLSPERRQQHKSAKGLSALHLQIGEVDQWQTHNLIDG
jgi:hypothetical protein